MKPRTLMAGAVALVLALGALPASAQGPVYANVIANAVCTVDGTDVLVSALLEQKPKPGPGTYEVGNVTFFLEQKIRGNPGFLEVAGSRETEPVNATFPEVAAGEQVEVAVHLYDTTCDLVDPNANAVRAVVEIEVLNANAARRGGLIHVGRCISFPNPCKQQG